MTGADRLVVVVTLAGAIYAVLAAIKANRNRPIVSKEKDGSYRVRRDLRRHRRKDREEHKQHK